MGSPLGFVKTLIVPALISLAVYVTLFFVILPFVRRYRQRYAQYLPLHTISAHTTSLRDRAADFVMRLVLPSTWRQRAVEGQDDDGSLFEDDGESGYELDITGREALERRRSGVHESNARLSQELEQGFMDESSDEEERNGRR